MTLKRRKLVRHPERESRIESATWHTKDALKRLAKGSVAQAENALVVALFYLKNR